MFPRYQKFGQDWEGRAQVTFWIHSIPEIFTVSVRYSFNILRPRVYGHFNQFTGRYDLGDLFDPGNVLREILMLTIGSTWSGHFPDLRRYPVNLWFSRGSAHFKQLRGRYDFGNLLHPPDAGNVDQLSGRY